MPRSPTKEARSKEFTSKPFKAGDLKDGRIVVTESWMPEKLWDIHTPQNMYDVDGFAADQR